MEQGTLTGNTNDGSTWTYTGDILNGLRHGKGTMTYEDGGGYEGDFADDEFHGKGKWTYGKDGERYVYIGDFVGGIEHGKGKLTYPDGEVYEGDWVNGKEHGKGKITTPSGIIFEGDFVDGITGKGKFTMPNGDVYEGENVDGKAHGKGKMIYADGDVYEGEWADDMFVKGKATRADGEVFEGTFVDGKPDKGTITTKDGKVLDADEYFSNSVEVDDKNKEKKIILICSTVGLVIGTIIGATNGNAFLGVWFGIGVGGALGFIPEIPGIFMIGYRDSGFTEALKSTFIGGIIWLVIFAVAGPIGILIRILKINSKIKKLQ
jgi:hypothetical protein